MSLNETKAELRAMFESTGQMPNKRIIDMQHQVLELIGVEHKYNGCYLFRQVHFYCKCFYKVIYIVIYNENNIIL